MSTSRSVNASKNIIVGVIAQIVTVALAIISRKIFVMFLSVDYLGINGLYSNILSVLALAELGLGNVAQYFLYKPIAENNHAAVADLMHFFRKIYRVIALAILTIGLLVIPFLDIIVKSSLMQSELVLYYILFLVNSIISYFSADKIAFLEASQDNRLQKYAIMVSSIVFQLVYIAVLMLWHNYTVYVMVTITSTIVNAVAIHLICIKKYPYVKKEKATGTTSIDTAKIAGDIKAMFVYKIGATIVNNTSNIMISVLINTYTVGLYSNYCTIVLAVQGFITIVCKALVSGIGNMSVSKNAEQMRAMFNLMLLVYNFIAVFGGISLYFLLNDFIPIWLGNEYLLGTNDVFAIAFAFYITNAISPLWMFREANGLFKKVKYLFLFTAAFNILFSILFGKMWGLCGILLAPSLARIITQVVYEPYVLYKNLFGASSIGYWIKQSKYVLLAVIAMAICTLTYDLLPVSFIFICVKGILFFVITVTVFAVGSAKTNELKDILGRIKKLIPKKSERYNER